MALFSIQQFLQSIVKIAGFNRHHSTYDSANYRCYALPLAHARLLDWSHCPLINKVHKGMTSHGLIVLISTAIGPAVILPTNSSDSHVCPMRSWQHGTITVIQTTYRTSRLHRCGLDGGL